MGRPRKFPNTRGVGICGTPGCPRYREEGHFLCAEHTSSIKEIKMSLEGREGDFANGFEKTNLKGRSLPTCCYLGCYELRIPPNSFCFLHADWESTEYE